MKSLIILLFLTLISFAQEKSDFNCVDKFESIETEIEFQKTISYKIISSKKLYNEESFEYSKGIIVVEDLNEILNTKDILRVMGTIALKNKLIEIIAFKTCLATKIYFKKTEPSEQEIKHLEENFIIDFKLDISESLSKKEKKKNKKKRNFIESVAIEVCKILTKGETNNFSPEKLSNVVVPKLSENVDKIMKVYDLSFEVSTDLFMKDLTLYLIDNCKIVNEYVNKTE